MGDGGFDALLSPCRALLSHLSWAVLKQDHLDTWGRGGEPKRRCQTQSASGEGLSLSRDPEVFARVTSTALAHDPCTQNRH